MDLYHNSTKTNTYIKDNNNENKLDFKINKIKAKQMKSWIKLLNTLMKSSKIKRIIYQLMTIHLIRNLTRRAKLIRSTLLQYLPFQEDSIKIKNNLAHIQR